MQESMSKGHVNGKNGIRKAHVYERWIDLIKRGNCSPHVETIRLLSNFFFFFFGSRRKVNLYLNEKKTFVKPTKKERIFFSISSYFLDSRSERILPKERRELEYV